MLTEHQYQLLTAHVDGELNDRDIAEVLALLHDSSEARSILRKLQADAGKVQKLPRAKLDEQFPKRVIEAIHKRKTRPSVLRMQPVRWALAASVLIAIVGGAWVLMKNDPAPVGPGPIVVRPKTPEPEIKSIDPQLTELVASTFTKYAEAIPEVGKRLPMAALPKELAALQEPAVHLEIRCRDSAAVLSRLQNALSGDGAKIWVDAKAQARLEQGEKADFLVFAENLPPEDVTKLLSQSAGEQFESVLFNPLSFELRKELSALLGVSVFQIEARRFDTVALPREPDEPAGIGKDGKAVRPKAIVAPKAALPPAERSALVVSSMPGETVGAASLETRRFLGSRRGNRAGTLQVVIVLHQEL